MKILIVGSNSFIGSNFIRCSKQYEIKEYCVIENPIGTIDFNNIDTILHLAGIVHQLKGESEENYFKINRDLAVEVAKRAKLNGVKHFIFMSTVKVYGELTEQNSGWDENSECFPLDAYGKSKLAAEQELLKLEDNKFIVSIIRSPLVYGNGVKGNILNIIKFVDRYFFLPFNGIKNKRSMVFVGNLIWMIQQIIEKRVSGVFIPCDVEPVSTSQLILEIANALNKKKLIIKFPIFLQFILKYLKPDIYNRLFNSLVVNNKLTEERLSYQPKYSFSYGVKEMVDWYKQSKLLN